MAKVEVPPTTVRLFGLARERLTWAELRGSPVLEQGINNAWAEELQGMLFRVLQGQAPSTGLMTFVSEGQTYRSVITRYSRSARNIYVCRILLIEIPRRTVSIGLAPAQTLLLASRYRNEVLEWGLERWRSGGFSAEADWRELCMRIEAQEAYSAEIGLAEAKDIRVFLGRREISDALELSIRDHGELLALARGRGKRGKEDRDRLLNTLQALLISNSRVISELVLSIGVAVEETGPA